MVSLGLIIGRVWSWGEWGCLWRRVLEPLVAGRSEGEGEAGGGTARVSRPCSGVASDPEPFADGHFSEVDELVEGVDEFVWGEVEEGGQVVVEMVCASREAEDEPEAGGHASSPMVEGVGEAVGLFPGEGLVV